MISFAFGWVIEIANIEKQGLEKYHGIPWCPQLYNAHSNLKYFTTDQLLVYVPASNLWNPTKIIAHSIWQSKILRNSPLILIENKEPASENKV